MDLASDPRHSSPNRSLGESKGRGRKENGIKGGRELNGYGKPPNGPSIHKCGEFASSKRQDQAAEAISIQGNSCEMLAIKGGWERTLREPEPCLLIFYQSIKSILPPFALLSFKVQVSGRLISESRVPSLTLRNQTF